MKRTQCAICPICGAACGLVVEVEDNRITALRGDRDDPNSRGHLCHKGMSLAALHADPDRIVEPLRRTARGGWEPVAWGEALDDIAGRLAAIVSRHGRDAVALYAGDATTHHYGAMFAVMALLLSLKTRNMYTANSMDGLPRLLASALIYGNPGMLPVPDVSRTSYFLVLGGNPVVTNGSIMIAPGFARHVRDLQRRGGRLVVVDPRRSETAAMADRHLFIRPGTDALFLLALVRTVFEERLDRGGALRRRVDGWRALERAAREFAPETVSSATGISADEIRRIAREFSASPSAVCYGRMGVCAQEFGTTATWLTDALNIVTGNLDRPGGAMFPSPAIDLAELMPLLGIRGQFGRWRSRVSGLPEFNGELPVAALAEEMEPPGDRRIRAFISIAGNPLVSVPNSARLARAIERLDLVVSIDPHLNATGRHAHYILPPAIGLEHDYYPLIGYGTAIRNTAKYAPPVLTPPEGVRHDWEIVWEIAQRVALRRAGAPTPCENAAVGALNRFDPKILLRLLLDVGPYGVRTAIVGRRPRIRFKGIDEGGHGVDLGLHVPRLDELMGTRRIDLAPDVLLRDLDRLRRRQRGAEMHDDIRAGTLKLISRRQRRFMNTGLHNLGTLAGGPEQCVLEINPGDAAARRIGSGDRVSVRTANGAIEAGAVVTDDVMPGVVSLPFGWHGRQSGTRMSVVDRHPGANVNEVTDETLVDAVSGMSAFNGTPVTVEKAGPPQR